MTERLPFLIEPMVLADIDEVMEIEHVAFPTPWSARAYRYEIAQNEHSTILALRAAGDVNGPLAHLARYGLARRLKLALPGPLLGYAGFWLLVDEAHIYTIAVHPKWRGRGLGELLLLALMEQGMELGASRATLEVRVSNRIAQELYDKYGFEIVSRRKGYYSDNNEDAYIMTTPSMETLEFQAHLDRWRNQLHTRLQAQGTQGKPAPKDGDEFGATAPANPQTASQLDKIPYLR